MLKCKTAHEQAYVSVVLPKKKKTELSLEDRLERLHRLKAGGVLNRVSSEDLEFFKAYKGPEVSGSMNKHRLAPAK